MKVTQRKDIKPSRYFKAYLKEIENKETGKIESQVQCSFSAKPFTAEQFISLVMGVMEAYAEQLLVNNSPESVYDNFNNAFGIFLAKIVPESYIYEHSEEHKKFKEHVDNTLGGEEDDASNQANKLAAYMLCHDILTREVGLDEDSANLILSKRLGTLKVGEDNAKEEN